MVLDYGDQAVRRVRLNGCSPTATALVKDCSVMRCDTHSFAFMTLIVSFTRGLNELKLIRKLLTKVDWHIGGSPSDRARVAPRIKLQSLVGSWYQLDRGTDSARVVV